MELPSWLGIPTLAFGLGSRTPQQGLVLAGGGSRASFQMGALRHLYDVVGITPTSMVATSAGSIVACTLAQWTDPAKQSAALRQLEAMWLEMTDQSDMFTPRAWFSRLLEIGPEWMSLLNREAAKTKSQRPWLSFPFLQLSFKSFFLKLSKRVRLGWRSLDGQGWWRSLDGQGGWRSLDGQGGGR